MAYAQSPIGKWKMVSHTTLFSGETIDSHAALVSVRPCAKNIVYEFTAEGIASLSAVGCEEKYKAIQEKLWSKTEWKSDGNTITTSNTNFAVGNTYQLSFNGNKMIWKQEGEKIEYQKW
jgi:hypothetical protein